MGGSGTVWRGKAFSCENSNDEIVLLHSRFMNGTIRVHVTMEPLLDKISGLRITPRSITLHNSAFWSLLT